MDENKLNKRLEKSFNSLIEEGFDPYEPDVKPEFIDKGYTFQELEELMEKEKAELEEKERKNFALKKSIKFRKKLFVVIILLVVVLGGYFFISEDNLNNLKILKYGDLSEVPMIYQWDEEWKDVPYSGSTIEIAGCGPTCLSMIYMYVYKDISYTPVYMAQFSEEHGYAVPGNGTKWIFFTEGAEKLGLKSSEIPLKFNSAQKKKLVIENLKKGNPIVCIMGPGHFTQSGHFIVLSGYEDGKIKVNDPNGEPEGKEFWQYEEFDEQIRNMWIFQKDIN